MIDTWSIWWEFLEYKYILKLLYTLSLIDDDVFMHVVDII